MLAVGLLLASRTVNECLPSLLHDLVMINDHVDEE